MVLKALVGAKGSNLKMLIIILRQNVIIVTQNVNFNVNILTKCSHNLGEHFFPLAPPPEVHDENNSYSKVYVG